MLKKLPETVAAVDLGSNSFHMIVCSLSDGKLITLDKLKEMVRLASGLDDHNMLDTETQERALACLERFGQRLHNFSSDSVRVVGTNTLRTAKNAEQFLSKAEKALGHPIHIISGIEEARLIYQGVAFSLGGHASQLRLVMDIGGGSTEYIIGEGDTPKNKESLHMGCVSVSNRFFKDGVLSPQGFTDAVLFAQQQLEPIEAQFQRANWQVAIGASGSFRAIARVLQAKQWSNNGITLEGLELLVQQLTQCAHVSELNFPDFDNERLPVFPGGVAIAYATFKTLGIEQMNVSDGALREGLIQDLLGRFYDQDIRSATTKTLTERFHTDTQHATQIKQTLQYLLTHLETQGTWHQDEQSQQFLNWAADLHEIGQDIAHSHYHKHSAYLIENGDLAGFSKQDQLIVAAIVRAHRRKFSPSRFRALRAPWHKIAPYLTLLLRLAVLLRRNRHALALPEFRVSLVKNKLSLVFPEGWLAQSPLTLADLQQEADFLAAAGFLLTFA
jgi:exopolyphosphatase/guanosine-5'-triphosphate,3'-diphosphate pyrophosphatase